MMKSIRCVPPGFDFGQFPDPSTNSSLTPSNPGASFSSELAAVFELKKFSGKAFASEKDMTEFILGRNNTNDIFMGVVMEKNWTSSFPKDFVYTIRTGFILLFFIFLQKYFNN